MKVLSLKEPFATLIATQKKKIETRSWKTNYRGELYIHASITKYKLLEKEKEMFQFYQEEMLKPGYILCKCQLIDCIYMTEEYIEDIKCNHPQEYLCGNYEVGRYAWILDSIELLEHPIMAKGKLGIWNYKEENKKKD